MDMLDGARIGIHLVESVVEAGRQVDVGQNPLGQQREVDNRKAGDAIAGQSLALAGSLIGSPIPFKRLF